MNKKKLWLVLLTVALCLGICATTFLLVAAKRQNGAPTGQISENAGNLQNLADGNRLIAKADNYEGTLTYKRVGDSADKIEISYELNGERKTFTVDGKLNYISGGFAATDDVGRSIYNQYSQFTTTWAKIKGNKAVEYTSDPRTIGVYGENGEHYVGLFYFLWMGEHGDSGIFDMNKIIQENGANAGSLSCGAWGPQGAMHFFAEPLYGYYYSSDRWVMRKHMELLCNANVDFLYFDVTNGYLYLNNLKAVMEILHELNEQGFDAPQVVLYTHSSSANVVKQAYDNIYSKDLYPDTWFMLDGKPLVIAEQSDNINDFFTIRVPQWPNEPNRTEPSMPWMDWTWPQRLFTGPDGNPESISVSIGQHSGNCLFSSSAVDGDLKFGAGNQVNRGRSFDGSTKNLTDDSYKLGLNFQRQFDYAVEKDVKFVLVTGWNEWVAQRQPAMMGYEIAFVDTCNPEYSRDIEMMRGGYFDNYYMQLVNNNMTLKGAAPVIVQDARHAIDVNGAFSQWDVVPVAYTDMQGDTVARKNMSFGKQLLTNETGRNDIVTAKITSDTTYMYFYVKCAENITAYDNNTSWMQIYLNTDNATTGWYGYDYILNYQVSDTASTIGKYNGKDNAFSFAAADEVAYKVEGNEMMIAVPMELIGIEKYDQIYVQFKCADSTTQYDEMEDFYIDGDVAPLGRLNWVYQNYIPGVTEGEGHSVVKVADKAKQIDEENNPPVTTVEETTEEPTSEETSAEVTTEDVTAEGTTAEETTGDTKNNGCGSLIGSCMVVTVCALAVGTVICKKKED